MHVATETAVLLAKEVQEHRDYFYNTFLRPYCEAATSSRKRLRQTKSGVKNNANLANDKNYINGQSVIIPFKVSHENQEDYLKHLDPTQWKDQDHYLVLGIGELRYQATDEDIKKAYKQRILRHHPDKRRQKGDPVSDETKDYFACITKANDVLSDPEKRKAYDSADTVVATVADDVPDKLEADERDKFFDRFGQAFRYNSRWSAKQPVPQLGGLKSKDEYVDDFYDFWYDFQSWRDFSYLDEPVTGEDRYERRYMEKENKAKRMERKNKEAARIRKLVDNAFNSDPRIVRMREEEKKRTEAKKAAKKEALRQKQEQEEQQRMKALEKEMEVKKQQEDALKAEAEKVKKEKEAEKKVLKKERKTLWDLLKGLNYFLEDSGSQLKVMQDTERLCDALSGLQLQELNQRLSSSDKVSAKTAFYAEIDVLDKKVEAVKEAIVREREEKEKKEAAQKQQETDSQWSDEEFRLLVKAVNLYPPGTGNRWQVVAEYINHHLFLNAITKEKDRKRKTAKDVIAKSKSLKQIDQHHDVLKNEVNSKAYDAFVTKQKSVLKPTKDDNSISERDSEQSNGVAVQGDGGLKPWSPAEQKQLEQCLKKFPASDTDRWQNIANEMQTRSKEECLKRYKELVEKIKAQKAAAGKASPK
ncbi:hypothetical protein RvY_02226 [Ramazzottius varieornatus]|uniref:DnaJ homolog subfamily C member 2 n=1 Tax=Ramazzottius varieornatus TaxID=947166 RepID=A0A1D1UJT6_RAMVA|nr:hypothetical protein RvY_02226 [Ramazzottius varieornatus]